MHLLPTLARLRIILLINGWGFVRTDIYLPAHRSVSVKYSVRKSRVEVVMSDTVL